MHELTTLTKPYNIELTSKTCEQFETYSRLLLQWNKQLNLTAITQPREVLEKHFLDSIMPLALHEIPHGAAIIDVGTGAGFPGIPLKIVRPDLRLTLLDSLGKRLNFLSELSRELGQQNEIIHARAEDAAHSPALRESFNLATSRAVAALPMLCELCLPYVRPGGVFIALKGPGADAEITAAQSAAATLGGSAIEKISYTLPESGERTLCISEKLSQTPPKYPRKPKQIAKTPL